ncbi:ERMES complex subunit mmm1 [Lobaria immixta]|nr:ERMES complex subunit mmm1 [Lobaria immixta]
MANNTSANAPHQQSTLSFTEGFLLGQLSVVILIGAFIKFFIFGDPPSPDVAAGKRALAHRNRSVSINSSSSALHKIDSKRSASHVLRTPPRLTTATILDKTYYNVNSHQPESLDWFNVLVAQAIAQFRNDAHHDDAILTSLTGVLNGSQKPDFLSSITVSEISLGEEFPILSNCRVHPINHDSGDQEGPRLQARMDVDLSDFITLGIETKIILNYPKPLTAVLPIALAVSVVRFSGTLSVSFLPSSSPPTPSSGSPSSSPPSTTPTTIAFSFLPDYRLDLSVRSLVGSRSRLQDIPKIAQLVESRLHAWIDERCVEPRVQQVVLPSLWPRKRNTRGPSASSGDEEQSEDVPPGEQPAPKRDVGEEARREVEQERAEGLRWRAAAATSREGRGYDMPGAMPGIMVS